MKRLQQRKKKSQRRINPLSFLYYQRLKEFATYLPILEKLDKIGKLTKEQKRLINILDNQGKSLIYTSNSLFAREFEREKYCLHTDIDLFCYEIKKKLGKKGLGILAMDIDPIELKNDYLASVISPLVWNLSVDPFKSKNELYQTEENKKDKYIIISSYLKNERSKKGSYILEIGRNGFSRSNNLYLLSQLFESTSQKTKKKQNLSLRDIQSFIEMNNGTIKIQKTETYPGNRLEFIITIPYNQKEPYSLEGDICIQD